KKHFKPLTVKAHFNNPYITLKPEYQTPQIPLFPQITDKRLIYKPKKPLYSSPSTQSSLPQPQIQYQHKRSPSIYLPFHLVHPRRILDDDPQFIIWT
ncbi:class I tRNA ligase family protein, partial [Staphylococcus saprophyticus]|uniref:class I tRNA ligase family protein n=1 Tax=Staphylococcus saprophyticus TaxID=29385 RepID=UPI00119CBE69